ncbi:MAG: thioredoxin domain-containing protein [bacterium]
MTEPQYIIINNSSPEKPEGEINQTPVKRWYKKSWGIFLIILVTILLILSGFLAYGFYLIMKDGYSQVPVKTAQTLDIGQIRSIVERGDRPSWGSASSSIVIVEFADFQCAHCQIEFPIIREIMNKYQNEVRFIFRSYPTIDENSVVVAQSAYCADEQGKFWQMHDRLFTTIGAGNFQMTQLEAVAKQSGLDLVKYQSCMSSEEEKAKILQDNTDATSLGLQGTPTFFINGYEATGEISKENWISVIEGIKNLK